MIGFSEMLQSHYQMAERNTLKKIKTNAWDHFQDLGLPTRKTEVYRYIKLRNLFSRSFVPATPTKLTKEQITPYTYPECHHLIFVNGHYQHELSKLPKGIVITSLDDAMLTYGAFLDNQWKKSVKEESDPFVTLNAALHQKGLFVYVPPKTVVDTPIQILHIVDTHDQSMMILPRIHLFVGKQSQVNLVSTQIVLSGTEYFVNQSTEATLEEGSRLNYTQVCLNQPADIWQLDAFRATLKRDSTLETVSVTDGSQTVRQDYRVVLTGENADALLNGLWNLSDKREAHTNILIDHQAPYCHSLQLFKGVLNDTSRSSFEGKIFVRREAQKTDAFQLNNNLLLSEGANAHVKPNLEIFADDVKASHGATVGQLDHEQLFYMKTRGFSDIAAKNLLVRGFCQEVIDKIHLPSLRQEVHSQWFQTS